MIKNKEHFKEGGRLIARQGAMKSGCIRRLMYIVGVFKDNIKRFSLILSHCLNLGEMQLDQKNYYIV